MAMDAPKLLERLSNTDRDPGENVDVTFTFAHRDFDYLIPLAEDIGDLFADKLQVEYDSVVIGYHEHPKVKTTEGKQEMGSPQFTLNYVGPLTADQFTSLHKLAAKFAKEHQLTYLGVHAW